MSVATIAGREDLISRVGQVVGTSDWFQITQDRINKFADATDDPQWIHVDPDMAAKGPFGKTIAHGYLTLSLIPALARTAVTLEGLKLGINYGLNRVRFITPVKVDSMVQLTATLLSATPADDGSLQATYNMVINIEDEAKPACVAEIIVRYHL